MRDFLHHLLFPRESNNHRAKVLHHDSLLVVIVVLLSLSVLLPRIHQAYPSVLGVSSQISIQDLLTITNQERTAHGLAPLKLNNQLSEAAEKKGENMFKENYWAHVAPDGTTPWVFIKNAGYDYLYAGENLARGFDTAPDVTTAWMNSPSHRENVLSPHYTDIGFSVQEGQLTGSDTILVVEEFGSKYIAGSEDLAASDSAAVAQTDVSPTIPPVEVTEEPLPAKAVASVQKPLIDSLSVSKQGGMLLLGIFIAVLLLDAVIVERKKIARVVSHNLDHVLFFIMILAAAILIGRGLII